MAIAGYCWAVGSAIGYLWRHQALCLTATPKSVPEAAGFAAGSLLAAIWHKILSFLRPATAVAPRASSAAACLVLSFMLAMAAAVYMMMSTQLRQMQPQRPRNANSTREQQQQQGPGVVEEELDIRVFGFSVLSLRHKKG
eukprot:jgi/Chrzof1/8875/Cz03g27180.t1